MGEAGRDWPALPLPCAIPAVAAIANQTIVRSGIFIKQAYSATWPPHSGSRLVRREMVLDMRAFFYSLLGYFVTPWGIVFMGALDSSLVFFLPLGIDFAVIILAARKPELFWLYAILATIGSLIGAMVTFWIGRKVGEHGLTRLMKPSRLERVRNRVSHHAGVGVAALAII